MNNFNKLNSVFLTGLFFLSMPAFSYYSDIQNCTDILEPSARLSCYDDIFQKNKSTEEAAITSQKIEVIKTDKQKKKDFGIEKPKQYTSVTAKILDVSKRGNYKIFITLDNDQVWRSVESIYDRVPVKKGQVVTITEAFISGFIMKVEGRKVSLRVRRVK